MRLAAGGGSTQARLSVERRTAGTPSYDQVVGNTNVSDSAWANVAVTNTAWNGSIPAGGAVTFGFIASWSGTNGLPTSFTLNDSVCLVP